MQEEFTLEELMQKQQEQMKELKPGQTAQINKLAPKHHAIMDYMLANPQMKLKHVAEHFGVTQAWLSTIIHSECFQSLLSKKHEEIFKTTIIPLKDKIAGLAHRTVERLSDKVEVIEDPKALKDIGELALKSLGYGVKTNIQAGDNANIMLGEANVNIIKQARDNMLRRQSSPAPLPPKDPEENRVGSGTDNEPQLIEGSVSSSGVDG